MTAGKLVPRLGPKLVPFCVPRRSQRSLEGHECDFQNALEKQKSTENSRAYCVGQEGIEPSLGCPKGILSPISCGEVSRRWQGLRAPSGDRLIGGNRD